MSEWRMTHKDEISKSFNSFKKDFKKKKKKKKRKKERKRTKETHR
jgi:hypothetical protein